MWVRKQLDIGWSDLVFGIASACFPPQCSAAQRQAEAAWSASGDGLACLSVRSGFDLLLEALQLPPKSELLISAVTIPDMVRIIEHHGLVPVPVDLDIPRMQPQVELLRRAITPATKAVVVAHLFGGRIPLGPILDLARQHGLLVIEDCAQAFGGPQYHGHPEADVSMFSFGPIKTATALGGAILRVRDGRLLARMRAQQAAYRLQSRWSYLRRLLKYAALKAISSRPVFSVLMRILQAAQCDYDPWVNGAVRGFAGPSFFARIRQQPSAPLLAVLERRLRTFDSRRLARRAANGQLLARLLDGQIVCPGAEMVPHTHWVFSVLAESPRRVIAELGKAGFDATQGQSLCVVPSPADRPELAAHTAADALERIVFLPFYPEMPVCWVRKMACAVLNGAGTTRPRADAAAPATLLSPAPRCR